jgi:hypothetical protein
MVGATRGTPEGFRPDQASGSQQPPLAPPNLAEVMARQTELLNQLVQAQMGYYHHQPRGRDEPSSASHQDFLSTQPSMSLSMLMLGFAPLSPSLHYCLPCVQMRTKCYSSLNNSEAPSHLVGSLSCHAVCRSCCHLG